MKFYLNRDTNPEFIFKSSNKNVDLQNRWVLRYREYFQKTDTGSSISAFIKTTSRDRKLQRTCLALCEDTFLERTVLAKTVRYEERELENAESIKMRRKMIQAQVNLLNNISSNMLPEPLDMFEIINVYDEFSCQEPEKFKMTEPVLILDYIPGTVLADRLQSTWDKSFYRVEEGKDFNKCPEKINVGAVMRLMGDILAFIVELYNKGYAYTSLSTDHIVLLGDNKPRFVGIGRICPIVADRYDYNHINFGRQLKGYSAPELNQKESNFGMQASVKAAIAYNLGVLIACIMLGKTEFNEFDIKNGAYEYAKASEERNAIKRAMHGQWIDDLIYKLTDINPYARVTDFEWIMQELSIISGDAKREIEKDAILHGTIKFLAKDKGYGYVTAGGEDYRVDLKRINNLSLGSGDPTGQSVTFVSGRNSQGQRYVCDFVNPPKTEVNYPRFVKRF